MQLDNIVADYQTELTEIWQNKKFTDPIAAEVYDKTDFSGTGQRSCKPIVENKTFLACIVEHSKCNGQVVTDNYIHHCFCPCYRFLIREEEFF